MSLEDEAASTSAAAPAGPAEEEVVVRSAPFPEGLWPSIDHLVFEDGRAVESFYFERLMRLLVSTLYASWEGPGGGRTFAAFADVGIFWEPKQTPLVPDVTLSLDVLVGRDLSVRENNSYLLWVVGKPPDLVIEFVSDRRGGEAGLKMRQYARHGVAYYVIFDPRGLLRQGELRAFELRGGAYEAIDPAFFRNVGLGLVPWEGEYERDRARWLRWCDRDGRLLPTPRERAEQAERLAGEAKRQADDAVRRAEEEKRRADRLAEKLRALGIDPATFDEA